MLDEITSSANRFSRIRQSVNSCACKKATNMKRSHSLVPILFLAFTGCGDYKQREAATESPSHRLPLSYGSSSDRLEQDAQASAVAAELLRLQTYNAAIAEINALKAENAVRKERLLDVMCLKNVDEIAQQRIAKEIWNEMLEVLAKITKAEKVARDYKPASLR